MASLGDLPTELFDQIIQLIGNDGPALLSLRASNSRYRNYIDSMVPEIAWRLARTERRSDRPEVTWVEQQIDNELDQVRTAYWHCQQQSKKACKELMEHPMHRPFTRMNDEEALGLETTDQDWLSDPDNQLSYVLATCEPSAEGNVAKAPVLPMVNQDWLSSSDGELSHVLTASEFLSCNDSWVQQDEDLPAILACPEDPFIHPLSRPIAEGPWWTIPTSSIPFVLRSLRQPAYTQYKAPHRNLARIRQLATLRDAVNRLMDIYTTPEQNRSFVIQELEFEQFLKYQAFLREELDWARPPRNLQRLNDWAVLQALLYPC
ncbi:MAG: hypothetical protein M1822_000016 [Bathelium mastoideum]|nr:MAG: hypothetical protein M1822_000016 [Bathelium mastoideum]